MGLWLRVFGTDAAGPDASALRNALKAIIPEASVQLDEGERDWARAEIRLPGGETPVYLERFWRDEEGIRAELQSWAAWLETCDYSENNLPLMQHMISTQQVFTLRRPLDHGNEIQLDKVCTSICQFLARASEGVYQVDQQGFFTADGTLLLQEY